MRSVCVYCGSSNGNDPAYLAAAHALGDALLNNNLTLVYGGASVGLMGAVADRVMAGGGRVVGVIPKGLLEKEVAHHGITELHVTASMHERKTKMAELADAFIALPGGIGTLEELFEAWTWTQLDFQRKPVGVLNVLGYFDGLLRFLDHSVDAGFLKPAHRTMLAASEDSATLLDRLASFEYPTVEKWQR